MRSHQIEARGSATACSWTAEVHALHQHSAMAIHRQPYPTAAEFLPKRSSLASMKRAVQKCHGCDLYLGATQAVFGEGLRRARLMLVGEQPGDTEDRTGRPFVGGSGKLLRTILQTVEIPIGDVYVTNAVKHFRYRRRGKKRIHDKPTHYQVQACKPWLMRELEVVRPEVLVLLGASAATALLGSKFRLTKHRAEPLETDYATHTFATLHPSALLRIPDAVERRLARQRYVEEFHMIADVLRAA